jgi:ABC-type transport system substrate-binding protein
MGRGATRSMHRRLPLIFLFLSLVLSACGGKTATPIEVGLPTPIATSTEAPPQGRALKIRFAILDDISSTNVWALFDEAGSSFWNEAVQAAYWPRLFQLADQRYDIVPAAADGFPSQFIKEGAFITATVKLSPNLKWTDGSEFTAADVAFTADIALGFDLGLKWKRYYDPEFLDHVEAIDTYTVKYYFGKQPNAAVWQYGCLLAPIVNRAYWEPKVAGAQDLLPSTELRMKVSDLEAQTQSLQKEVDKMQVDIAPLTQGNADYQTERVTLNRAQSDLDVLKVHLDASRAELNQKLVAARRALYALDNVSEPTLGPWKFAEWKKDYRVENVFNPEYFMNGTTAGESTTGTYSTGPFFDRAVYILYPSEAEAVSALRNDQVDFILTPHGLSPESVTDLSSAPNITVVHNQSSSMRLLAFNNSRSYLADKVMHQALACMLDLRALAHDLLKDQAAPAYSLVPSQDLRWYNPDVPKYCDGQDGKARLEQAVLNLKAAGYTWDREPSWDTQAGVVENGKGLRLPDGTYFPQITLLTPEAGYDPLRVTAAAYIARQASQLAIPLKVKSDSYENILLDVYGTGNYDLALLGWKLDIYPDYLCTFWDQVNGNPYYYQNAQLQITCQNFLAEADLEKARQDAYALQDLLADGLPFLPLYVEVVFDAYRNLGYPYTTVLNGLGPGLYGAPSLAVPASR